MNFLGTPQLPAGVNVLFFFKVSHVKHPNGQLDFWEGLWLLKANVHVGLEVPESGHGEDAGDGEDTGDGEEAGGAGCHHGGASFSLWQRPCFGFTAFLHLSLNSLSFLHPVNVGSGIVMKGLK